MGRKLVRKFGILPHRNFVILRKMFDSVIRYNPKNLDIDLLFSVNGVIEITLMEHDNSVIEKLTLETQNGVVFFEACIVNNPILRVSANISKNEISYLNGRVLISNKYNQKVKDLLTKCIYLFNFKKNYPKCEKDGVFSSEYMSDLILFPKVRTIKFKSLLSLPEFFIDKSAIEELDKIIDDDNCYYSEPPFKNFNVLVSVGVEFLVNCFLDSEKVRLLIYHFNSGRLLFAANFFNNNINHELVVYHHDDFDAILKAVTLSDNELESLSNKLICTVVKMIYFYNNYYIDVEENFSDKDMKSEEEKSASKRNYNSRQNVISIPRKRYIFTKNQIADIIRRREQEICYTATEWERAGYYRLYRNTDGSVKRKVHVSPTKCHRRKSLLRDGKTVSKSKKKYVLNAGDITKAVKPE